MTYLSLFKRLQIRSDFNWQIKGFKTDRSVEVKVRKDETVSAYQSPFELQNVRILYPFYQELKLQQLRQRLEEC